MPPSEPDLLAFPALPPGKILNDKKMNAAGHALEQKYKTWLYLCKIWFNCSQTSLRGAPKDLFQVLERGTITPFLQHYSVQRRKLQASFLHSSLPPWIMFSQKHPTLHCWSVQYIFNCFSTKISSMNSALSPALSSSKQTTEPQLRISQPLCSFFPGDLGCQEDDTH